jgi:hypothetical protein
MLFRGEFGLELLLYLKIVQLCLLGLLQGSAAGGGSGRYGSAVLPAGGIGDCLSQLGHFVHTLHAGVVVQGSCLQDALRAVRPGLPEDRGRSGSELNLVLFADIGWQDEGVFLPDSLFGRRGVDRPGESLLWLLLVVGGSDSRGECPSSLIFVLGDAGEAEQVYLERSAF